MNQSTQILPDPITNNYHHVWDLVIKDLDDKFLPLLLNKAITDDMQARDQVGFERYQTHLQPFNGRPCLIDAYQEALDCAVYLRQDLEEGKNVSRLYQLALDLVIAIKIELMKRENDNKIINQ